MSMLLDTYQCLLADIREKSGVPFVMGVPDNITMDWVLIEGPKLDKQLLMYLEDDRLEQPVFPSWLRPLWVIFTLTKRADILQYIRQLLVFCYKAEFVPSNEQRVAAVTQFLDTDLDIETWNSAFEKQVHTPLFRKAQQLVSRVIHKIDWLDITPSHGPGAVFPPRSPVEKSDFDTVYSKLDQAYPFADYFCGIPSFWWDVMVKRQDRLGELPYIDCNLAMVPKDSRGPRLISVHPKEAIWIQQGQRRLLEQAIAASPRTSKYINFKDQKVNGKLALESSLSGEFVTLDLKEASDRLSNELVKYLFGTHASSFMQASRADRVVLPGGCVHELRKFAPMGNCLTFPVQSLVFWALVQAGIECRYGAKASADVYVFGDDIIYPSVYHDGALNGLIRAGLVPNMGKTFKDGFFRESCGVDAYRGIDITPFRLRVSGVASYSDVESICSLAKRMRLDGYQQTSAKLYSLARGYMGKLHLCNNPDAQGIYEYTPSARDCFLYGGVRFNRKFQRWETPLVLLQATMVRPGQDEWYHLQDSLIGLALRGSVYSDRRYEYPVPYRARLKHGWAQLLLED